MTDRNKTSGNAGGMRKQTATGSLRGNGESGLRAHGLVSRGVVLATYRQLDGDPAFPETVGAASAVYCDVLLYSASEGMRGAPLRRVLVAQDCGMHDGHVWLPRAATMDVSKTSAAETGLDIRTADPQNLDGDHVLIQYIDDSFHQPVITRRLPHPRMGQGNESLASAGHRMKLKLVDGNPDFWKHHGSFVGFDNEGGFIVDTSRAHNGALGAEGAEEPADNAANGDQTFVVNSKATFRIVGVNPDGAVPKFELLISDNSLVLKLVDGNSLQISGNGSAAVATIGDGTFNVPVVEKLQALYEALVLQLATHIHADGWGGTLPPTVPPVWQPWDPTINSTKIKI